MSSSASRAAVVKRARRVAVVAVTTASLHAARVAARVIDPGTAASWLMRGAQDPAEVAFRTLPEIDALIPPEPGTIVANYLRGRVLFGKPGRRDVRFSYRWDPQRGVIDEQSKRIPKRIRTLEQRMGFEVRYEDDFEPVVEATRREFTWITDDVKAVYLRLHELGLATAVGVYQGGELVGGLWGTEIGSCFGLMSVFHRVDHAGSMALIAMVNQLGDGLRWQLVDVGQVTQSFERFGAHPVPVDEFTDRVLASLAPPSRDETATRRPIAVAD